MGNRTWILVFVFLLSCIDRIEVDTTSEPDRIVVDGFITSEQGEQRIKITRTNKFSSIPNLPIRGALVKIISSIGEEEVLGESETEPGYYLTGSDFKAVEDVNYKIRIETEGKVIESYEQQLPQFVPMDGIEYVASEGGMTINSYITENEGGPKYFLWDLRGTFVFDARLARSEAVRRCWITNNTQFQQILIHEDNEGGYNHEIIFMRATADWNINYSLLVTQYNIPEDAYNYWDNIKVQRESVGSIFDPPPYSISGNLYNSLDDKDIILGYFGVYHISKTRLSWTIYDIPYNYLFQEPCASTFYGRPPECLNCLAYSGGTSTNIPPEWWGQ